MDNTIFLNGAPAAQPTTQQDYPEWHRGRSDYAVWLLLLDDPRVTAYINYVRCELADILLPAEQRALHITLQAAGFPCASPVFDDDVAVAILKRQAAELTLLPAFTLQLASINAFQSALYVPVVDVAGGLKQARAILNSHTPEIAANGYTPHVTVGLFKPVADALLAREAIWARLQQLNPLPPITINVRELQLVSYQARELQGPLTVLERVALR